MVQVSEPNIYLRQTAGMVPVSEHYILASAYRMVQVSKPCRHIDLTKHAYAILIKSEYEHDGETHLAQYTTQVAHC